jgi:hypothetical protein
MAAYTVSVNRNFHDAFFSTRTGADTYTIDTGAVLTVDGDTRYGPNTTATTGSPASFTISSTSGGKLLFDASNVRLIPYNTGAGNVPAAGTTISQGGVSGSLLGVWSAINAAPTAAGAAMPATGFIKVRQVTGGAYAAGALTGISASATGADIAGWIEICADELGTLTIPRLGEWEARGTWFDLGNTSGSRGQVLNLPTSGGAAFWLPGVWIETAASSGVFEFWPALNVLTGGGWTTANQGTDARSRFVQILAGQVRIGSDGTNNIGELPGSGRRVVIPNVILQNNTTAARGATAVPNATLGSRFETLTTSAGVLDLQYVIGAWYINVSQAFSVDFVNVAMFDQVLLSEVASPVNWNGGGVGIYSALDAQAFTMTSCLAGGLIQNCKFGRAGTIASGDNSNSVNNCIGQTFTSCWFYQGTLRTNATLGFGMALSQSSNLTFNACTVTSGFNVVTCSNTVFNNTVYLDRHIGTTGTTLPTYAFTLSVKCADIQINGLTFGGFTNVHPYNGLVSISACDRVKVRNIGTAAAPLEMGSANASGVIFNDAGNCTDIRFQRVYTQNTRTGLYATQNSTKTVLFESVWGDTADSIGGQCLDLIHKGCRGFGTPVSAYTSVYGTIFYDTFNATTTGKLGLFFNEPTSASASFVERTGGSVYTSTGSLYIPTLGDTATYTWPHFVRGYTGFSILNPTLTGGTTVADRMDVAYQIDKNDGAGFSGWKNLRYPRAGGGGANGAFTVTMTSTTGVAVGDYVFGTGIGTNARVTSVDNATTVTVNVANSGAVSGILVFSQLGFETGISAANGFKMKVRFTANATSVNNTINLFHFQGATDSSSQQTQYPLDLTTLTLTGLQSGTDVVIYAAGTETVLTSADSVSSFSYQYETAGVLIDIGLFKAGYIPLYIRGYSLPANDSSLPIAQVVDRYYIA